jgi:hypothetical protein
VLKVIRDELKHKRLHVLMRGMKIGVGQAKEGIKVLLETHMGCVIFVGERMEKCICYVQTTYWPTDRREANIKAR